MLFPGNTAELHNNLNVNPENPPHVMTVSFSNVTSGNYTEAQDEPTQSNHAACLRSPLCRHLSHTWILGLSCERHLELINK